MISRNGKIGALFVAVMATDMQAARFLVDVGDPQPLAPWILFREATGEKVAGGGEAVELQREFGTLITHTPLLIAERGIGRVKLGPKCATIAKPDQSPAAYWTCA